MRLLSRIFLAIGFSLLAASAGATPDNPQNGKDYLTLDKPQQTDSSGKVEVLEFFWYNCPHCNVFDPSLTEWVKKQGDKIVFKRVPVIFRDSFVPQQRLYYALEAMGKADEMQPKILRAIHIERKQLDTEQQIVDFIAKQGIDKQKFLDLYHSFGVDAKVKALKGDGEEMQTMLEAYMNFARGAGGEKAEPSDIALMIAGAVKSGARPHSQVKADVAPELVAKVKPNAFRRLILNLIANAARFGQEIAVKAKVEGSRLVITVDDNGPGIPANMREDVFRPFFRLDEARNQDEPGTGLGLSIARDIARSHGGDITLEDSPLGGLRAVVRIPV